MTDTDTLVIHLNICCSCGAYHKPCTPSRLLGCLVTRKRCPRCRDLLVSPREVLTVILTILRLARHLKLRS